MPDSKYERLHIATLKCRSCKKALYKVGRLSLCA